eukprot:7028140-Pyramimonas_sp.AAC.1
MPRSSGSPGVQPRSPRKEHDLEAAGGWGAVYTHPRVVGPAPAERSEVPAFTLGLLLAAPDKSTIS